MLQKPGYRNQMIELQTLDTIPALELILIIGRFDGPAVHRSPKAEVFDMKRPLEGYSIIGY